MERSFYGDHPTFNKLRSCAILWKGCKSKVLIFQGVMQCAVFFIFLLSLCEELTKRLHLKVNKNPACAIDSKKYRHLMCNVERLWTGRQACDDLQKCCDRAFGDEIFDVGYLGNPSSCPLHNWEASVNPSALGLLTCFVSKKDLPWFVSGIMPNDVSK